MYRFEKNKHKNYILFQKIGRKEKSPTWTTLQSSGSLGYSESHTWNTGGSYTIKAKVKDENGLESDWIILSVSMPKNKTTQTLLLRFLEQHPHLSQLLKQLLNKIKI